MDRPISVYKNSNLAPRLRAIKQRKLINYLSSSVRFLLFYSPKPRTQVRILHAAFFVTILSREKERCRRSRSSYGSRISKSMGLQSFPWRQTAFRNSLWVIKFASLSSFVAEKRVNFRANSLNKKHSWQWCKPSATFLYFFLSKVEEVRLYTWHLLTFTKMVLQTVSV